MNKTDKVMNAYADNIRGLLALARSIVCEASEAEDVLQDVIVKLLSNPTVCEKVKDPLAFLRTCVRHEAIDHVRRLGRETLTPTELLSDLRESMSEEEFKRVENMLWLSGYLEGLSPEMREAFIRVTVDGCSIASVSREMGVKQDTLRKRLDVVKDRMKQDRSGFYSLMIFLLFS